MVKTKFLAGSSGYNNMLYKMLKNTFVCLVLNSATSSRNIQVAFIVVFRQLRFQQDKYMKKFLIATLLTSLIPFSVNALADEHGKDERKFFEEQRIESIKHQEEQERESRKFQEEQDREYRKHWEEKAREEKAIYREEQKDREEFEREDRKHYEEGIRESRKKDQELEREARKKRKEMEKKLRKKN